MARDPDACCPHCGHFVDGHSGHFMRPKVDRGSTFRCNCGCVVDRDMNLLTERPDGTYEVKNNDGDVR